jgi:PEGA domain
MLPIRLPRSEGARSLRFLPRRVIQAMAENATANMILGERAVPSRFLVLRLAGDAEEKAEQESQFADSRDAIEGEVLREARARDFRLRGALELEVRPLLEAELDDPLVAALLRSLVDEEELPATLARLREEKELILARRLHRLQIDSRPRGAAVYVDHRQLDRVTPCRLDDLPGGTHAITLSLPGYLLHEGIVAIDEQTRGAQQQYLVELEPEPPMGVLELMTFPGQATATVALGARRSALGSDNDRSLSHREPSRGGGRSEATQGAAHSTDRPERPEPEERSDDVETRETPTRFRLPAGPCRIEITRPDYAPLAFDYELPPGPDERPARVQLKLEYAGDDRDVPVGTLIVYKPDPTPRPRELRPLDRPEETISTFFRDTAEAGGEVPAGLAPAPEPELLGERPLYKGVLVIGRDDRNATVTPDVKLFDPGNTVSRGCHAWLHVYTDPGTGAEYNTFVITNNSPGGILVDGRVVMESVALGDSTEIQIGIFRMRIRKETPAPSVQF